MGITPIPVFDSWNELFNCNFAVTDPGPSIMGLTVMKWFPIHLPFLAKFNNGCTLKDLILKCSQATGNMKVPPAALEVTNDVVFL